MIDDNAGNAGKTEKLGSLQTHDAVEHAPILVNQERNRESEFRDRVRDTSDMAGLDRSDVAARGSKGGQWSVDEFQSREQIIPQSSRDAVRRREFKISGPVGSVSPQQIGSSPIKMGGSLRISTIHVGILSQSDGKTFAKQSKSLI